MELVKNIAAVVGCISAIIALIATCSKTVRAAIKSIFKKQTSDIVATDNQQNKDIQELKQIIMDMKANSEAFHKHLDERLATLSEGTKDMLRHRIMTIYHRYKYDQRMPIHERETLDELYKDYRNEGGNSYITKYYNRMLKWETYYEFDFDTLEECETEEI